MAIEFHSVALIRNAENVSEDIINQFVKQQGAIPMQVIPMQVIPIHAGNTDVSNTNVSNSDENTTDSTTLTSPVPRTKVKVLLQTARTQAYAVNGEKVPVRVLFDSGSQKSYITNQLKARLGLTPIKKELLNLNVFGSVTTRKQSYDVVKVKLQGKYNEDAEILALGFSTICSPLPRTVELHQYPQLRELELADCTPSKEEEKESLAIDILIGCDFHWEIVSGDISRANGGLVAIRSKFGWLLSGPARHNRGAGVESHCNLIVELPNNVTTVPEEGESKIVDELKKFWETEAIGIVEREDIDQEIFPEQVRYDFIGRRYTVSLPWKIYRPHSNNYGFCISRLHQLMSRLKRDQALLTEYNKILETQLEEGIIEAVPTTEMNSQEEVYYLPHHGVVRTDKDTTKLRIVLDASARAGPHHYSLNECLEKGPNLTPLIFDVLVKFRGNIIGITADIEKAFHQIIIAEKDQNMLRMLWFNDVHTATPKIVHYRFCRLVFGLTPSPAILRGVIQYHLSKYQTSNPHVARLLADMLYVDDFPGGAENSEKGFKLYQEAKEIMKAGGFNLRKWRTNSSTLQKLINQTEANTNEVEGKLVKILGLCWDTQEDTFWFDPEEITTYAKRLPTTKRSVLRISTRIFDLLGFISPVTITAKMLFQKLCMQKIGWDNPLSGDTLAKWEKFIAELPMLIKIYVPRCYVAPEQIPTYHQIHGFSDASEKAYAAVVYLRTVYDNGRNVAINIITSKTRVAPLKKQSIPRLELLGVTILARLMFTVQGLLKTTLRDPELYYWTDSFTTLCWIKHDRPWKQYVQHRVEEIRKLTEKSAWRFCPGKENPVDIPSRSCNVQDLIDNALWWKGPSYLRGPSDS